MSVQPSSLIRGSCDAPPKKGGDYFGENALLRDEPRTATITAEGALSTFKITRDKFQELGLNDKLQFASRKAVGAGGGAYCLFSGFAHASEPFWRERVGDAQKHDRS